MTTTSSSRPIEPADLFRLKFIQAAQLSPDGKSVVYAVSHIDPEKEKEFVTLWHMPLETGATRQLTNGQARDEEPQWSPDGTRIAFRSTRESKSQIYIIPVDGGEARTLTDMPQGVGGGPVLSPDGRYIAFTAGPQVEPRDPSKPYRITRHVYRFNGLGYMDEAVQDIYVTAVAGGEPQRLTNDGCHNTRPQWSPDGDGLLYLASFCPESHRYMPHLRLVRLSGETQDLVGDWGYAVSGAWLPDGKHVVFIGTPIQRPFAEKSDLWVISREGGEPECRTAGSKLGVGGALSLDMPVPTIGFSLKILVAENGLEAYVMGLNGGTYHIYRISLRGSEEWAPMITGNRSCVFQDMSKDHLLFAATTFNEPTNLFLADLTSGDERQLTYLNAELLAQCKLPMVEHLLFPGEDGIEVEGWLMIPPEGERPYPTILYIHGGRHAAYGHGFSFVFQMLAGAGYGVLFINYRGSHGYGDAFAKPVVGNWGSHDYGDLMAGLDLAIEKGLADPERLGCTGGSAGGTLSCWIVGHTDRFKATVAENPVTDWVSEHGTSDIGPWFHEREFGGSLNDTIDITYRNSAISYAHRCMTPTLLIHHEEDYRCPSEQVEEFYTVLKVNGCIVEMVRFPNSHHGGARLGDPLVRRVRNEVLLDWMDRYVRGFAPDEGIFC